MEQQTEQILEILKNSPGLKFICHPCSICNYPCGWLYDQSGIFKYDSGCGCVKAIVQRPVQDSNLDNYIKRNKDSEYTQKEIEHFLKIHGEPK